MRADAAVSHEGGNRGSDTPLRGREFIAGAYAAAGSRQPCRRSTSLRSLRDAFEPEPRRPLRNSRNPFQQGASHELDSPGVDRNCSAGLAQTGLAKAKAGELNLARTVWALRQTTASGSRRRFSHGGAHLASECPTGPDRLGMWPSGNRPPSAGALRWFVLVTSRPTLFGVAAGVIDQCNDPKATHAL